MGHGWQQFRGCRDLLAARLQAGTSAAAGFQVGQAQHAHHTQKCTGLGCSQLPLDLPIALWRHQLLLIAVPHPSLPAFAPFAFERAAVGLLSPRGQPRPIAWQLWSSHADGERRGAARRLRQARRAAAGGSGRQAPPLRRPCSRV